MGTHKLKVISILLAASIVFNFTACKITSGESSQQKAVSSIVEQATEESQSDGPLQTISVEQLVSDLQSKYESDSLYVHQPSLSGISQDEVFYTKIDFDPAKKGISDLTEICDVFYDEQLTLSVGPEITYDDEKGELVINPPAIPSLDQNLLLGQNKWGMANPFYLAKYLDENGNKLEKPEITMFFIENEIQIPILSYKKSDVASSLYRWTPVEGADEYYVYAVQVKYSETWGEIVNAITRIGTLTETSFLHDETHEQIFTKTQNLFYRQSEDYEGYKFVFVVAVKDGEYSQASNLLDVDSFRGELVAEISVPDSQSVLMTKYVNDIPAFVVDMRDGSSVDYPVTYFPDKIEETTIVDYYGEDMLRQLEAHNGKEFTEEARQRKRLLLPYQIDGTLIAKETIIAEIDYDEFDNDLAKGLTENGEARLRTDYNLSSTQISDIFQELYQSPSLSEDITQCISYYVNLGVLYVFLE